MRSLVESYADHKPSIGEVDSYPMIDLEGDHYIAMQTGWVNSHRVHGAFLHLDIADGKVLIQFNGTDADIVEELVAAGIPREDIVLVEKPAAQRMTSGIEVA